MSAHVRHYRGATPDVGICGQALATIVLATTDNTDRLAKAWDEITCYACLKQLHNTILLQLARVYGADPAGVHHEGLRRCGACEGPQYFHWFDVDVDGALEDLDCEQFVFTEQYCCGVSVQGQLDDEGIGLICVRPAVDGHRCAEHAGVVLKEEQAQPAFATDSRGVQGST